MRFNSEGLFFGLLSGSDNGAGSGGGAASSVLSSDGRDAERWTGAMDSGPGVASAFGSGSGVGARDFSGSGSGSCMGDFGFSGGGLCWRDGTGSGDGSRVFGCFSTAWAEGVGLGERAFRCTSTGSLDGSLMRRSGISSLGRGECASGIGSIGVLRRRVARRSSAGCPSGLSTSCGIGVILGSL